MNENPVSINTIFEASCKPIRDRIAQIEAVMYELPGALIGDAFPLTHSFVKGLYVREIRVPKGMLVVTKLFKQPHATFLLQGECSILTEKGVQHIKAPYSMITPSGTKRVIYIHEDVIWTTVHPNPENYKTVEELEGQIIAKNYNELDGAIELESFVKSVKGE